MNNDFCPLINDRCKTNCVFLECVPGTFGLTNQCSLAATIKDSANRPDSEFFAKLEKLVNKI